MHLAYSTTDVELPQRFAYWHDVVCRHCIPAASRAMTRDAFDGRLDVRTVGALTVTTMASPQHHWAREAVHVRTRPDDDLWVALGDGEGTLTQSGKQAAIGDQMVLYDGGRAFEATLTPRKMLLLRVPRNALLQRFASAERAVAREINPRLPGAAPLRAMLFETANCDFTPYDDGVAERFADTLIDLLGVTLSMQQGVAGETVAERDLYARLLTHIHRNFYDSTLSLEILANAHSVSSRTVTRAFARHGHTAMRVVWQARLGASRKALVEGRATSITDAAFQYGFSDVSHFSRAFRKAYGCTPSALLRRR